jgi:hypothetical protein
MAPFSKGFALLIQENGLMLRLLEQSSLPY